MHFYVMNAGLSKESPLGKGVDGGAEGACDGSPCKCFVVMSAKGESNIMVCESENGMTRADIGGGHWNDQR